MLCLIFDKFWAFATLTKVSRKVRCLWKLDPFNLIFKIFCRYLEVEWEAKRKMHREFSKSTMIDLYPRVPKQDNSSDCGVYLLQYVESFFEVQMETTFPFAQN